MTPEAARLHSSTRPHHTPPAGRDEALAARCDACVLLTGAADPAREFAYRLHLASGWRHGPFTVVDCRSSGRDFEARLFEALFDPPATPGVLQIRLAQAGTVLLQEIHRLPLPVQRTLAGRLMERLRPGRSRRRIIASTSEPLFERVCDGTFDDALFYRLNTIQFVVPAVRANRQA